jgi:uncharacterized protein (TIGR02145 family)
MKNSKLILLILLVILIISNTCKKLEKSMLVSTGDVTNILTNTADVSGVVVDLGEKATEHGHYYATDPNVTIAGSKTELGQPPTGGFTSQLTNLQAGTKYYVKAYITDGTETVYGKEKSFTTIAASLPTIATAAIIAITTATATSGGDITDDGGAAVTARGVCWSTSIGPSITDNKTTDGTGKGIFASNLTGLTANTTYYVHAYATNSAGTAYGNQESFTTDQASVTPTVTTSSATDVATTSATVGGNITSDGGETVTERGIWYSANSSPETTGTKLQIGNGIGIFSTSLTGLTIGTKYYIKAYAINSIGTAYGDELSFVTTSVKVVPTLTTTVVMSITQTTSSSGGNISSDGGAVVSVSGVCWSTSANPVASGNHSTDGAATGAFTSSITGLTENTTYYVRAYATNSVGTAYGNELTFTTTSSTIVIPTLSTTTVTAITQTTANSGGNVTSNGGATVTASGICWSITTNPTVALTTLTTDGTATGAFTSSITGLTANITYYVRAYATNSVGTAYGNEITFTTSSVTLVVPTLTTTAATSITQTTAITGGDITSDGGAAITASGVCWSTTTNPIASGSHTTDGTATGTFTSSITGLRASTTYYVRSFATNSVGTAYGNEVSLTTQSVETGSFTDTRDSQEYQWVKIGEQVWMSENLAYLPSVSPSSFLAGTIPYCYVYDYQGSSISEAKATSNYATYGVLYNWPAAMAGSPSSSANPSGLQGVCPDGWHLPSDAEWKQLEMFLGMSQSDADGFDWRGTDEGSQLADNASLWTDGILESDPSFGSSGFKALPGGSHNNDGTFIRIGIGAYWWTSEGFDPIYAWRRLLRYDFTNVNTYNFKYERGYSVRCVEGQGANLPMVSTDSPGNISQNSATVGGNVTDDGGGPVSDRGIYYSTSANAEATGTKLQISSGTGSFSTSLTGLTAGTLYYIIAYATNSIGTSYGVELNFTTSTVTVPDAPSIGTATAGDGQAVVTFTAPISDGGSTITGYTVTSSPGGFTGTGSASPITVSGLISGTAYTFTVTATNAIGTGPASSPSNSVTPSSVPDAPIIGTATAGNAQATVTFTAPVSNGGSAITGYTVTSNPGSFTGTGSASPVTVTWILSGTAYTFTVTATNGNGIGPASAASNSITPSTPEVTSPATGTIWMDRNLGASQVATSSTDVASYGDLYQWGRAADGHQLRTSGTTSTLSGTDAPGNANFILTPNSPNDWRSPQNNNLWQGVNGVNNPCPTGFRIPTSAELDAERDSWSSNDPAGAYDSPLKLPEAGVRWYNGFIYMEKGSYWSSTIDVTNSYRLYFYPTYATVFWETRASGGSVRCIKD